MNPNQNPWYHRNYPSSSAVVSLAYHIAEKAHAGINREKKHGEIPYITHPIMVCLLLQHLGAADDLNMAIALLHDVLEDCEPYRSQHKLLFEELQQGLLRAGFDKRAADNTANYIFQHCEELCNDQVMEEGKRTYQVMHAHAMTDRSKLIKILDQAASVIDDVFMESSRPRDKIERFAMKALNVVKAASRGGTPEILAATNFFHECYVYLRRVHRQLPQEQQWLREDFRPEDILASIMKRPQVNHSFSVARYAGGLDLSCMHPAIEVNRPDDLPLAGCTGISFVQDKRNELLVNGYDCLIDRTVGEFSVANRAVWYLMGELESFERDNHVDVSEARVEGKQLVRHYTINPPMPYGSFVRAARAAEEQVRNSARENGVDIATLPRHPVLDKRMMHHINKEIMEVSGHKNSR